MGFRFRKSLGLAPGVRVNVSEGGLSLSSGVPGATMSLGKNGVRATAGLPGSGLSYSTLIARAKCCAPGEKSAIATTVGDTAGWSYGLDTPAPPAPRRAIRRYSMLTMICGVVALVAAGPDHPGVALISLLGAPAAGIAYLAARAKDARAARDHAKGIAAVCTAGRVLAEDQLTVLLYFARGDSRLQRAERDIIVTYAVQEGLIPDTAQVALDEAIRKQADPGTPAYTEAVARLAQYAPADLHMRLLAAAMKIVSAAKTSDQLGDALAVAREAWGLA